MSNVYCIYHKNCADGAGAAWVVDRFFDSNVTFKAYQYGDPVNYNAIKDKILFIVDFSFPRTILENIESVTKQLILLDHHKTAEEDLKSFVPKKRNTHIEFDMERSGAKMTWDYFYGESHINTRINLIQDRDLWQFKYPETKPFVAFLYFKGTTVDAFRESMKVPLEEAIKIGEVLEESIDQRAKSLISNVYHISFEGYENVPVINCPSELASVVGNLLAEKSDVGFSISYNDSKGKRNFSLRSVGNVDVSELARRYDGGGHKNAAGFIISGNVDPLAF